MGGGRVQKTFNPSSELKLVLGTFLTPICTYFENLVTKVSQFLISLLHNWVMLICSNFHELFFKI